MSPITHFHSITIPKDPTPWRRPHFNKRRGLIFDSNRKSIQTLLPFIKGHTKDTHPDPTLYKAPIEVRLGFVFKRPLSHLKSRDKKALPFFVTKTPDIDNLSKLILDLFTKRIIEDDKQVVQLSAVKKWGDEGCIYVDYKKA